MINKILHVNSNIRPGGGPAGYLYNLKKTITKDSNFNVFSPEQSQERDNTVYNKRKIPVFLLRHLLCIKYIFNLLGLFKIKNENEILNYKYILSHTAPITSRILKINKASIIGIMPHGPLSYSIESLDDLEDKYGKFLFRSFYQKILNKLENNIFKKVDFISVATKDGIDGYNNITIDFDKLFEVTTGLPGLETTQTKESARKSLGLPADKFIVGYFGRYNHHKGYDYLCSEIDNNNDKNILFISAGVGPLSSTAVDNYIDFGWRKDIDILITSCDFIVVPNRFTYFDLLPLECLSLSRPVILSNVGGNKTLAKIMGDVRIFNLQNGSLNTILTELAKLSNQELNNINQLSKTIFDTNFNEYCFNLNHEKLFHDLSIKFK